MRNAWRLAGLILAIALVSTPTWCGKDAGHPAKQEAPKQILDLYRAETIDFSAPPPGAVTWPLRCDANGNIFALYATSLQALQSGSAGAGGRTVTGIFSGSKRVVRYPLPPIQGYRPLIALGFAVSPRGKVYALAATALLKEPGEHPRPAFIIVEYNDDGTVDSYFKVADEPGNRLRPLRMALFGDGNFLLSGTTTLENGMGTFSGVFDRQGTFTTPLKLGEATDTFHGKPVSASEAAERFAKSDQAKPSRAKQLEAEGKNPVGLESSTLSFSSQDGNVYVLQGTSEATLYAVSPAGEIVRQYRLKPPEPGMSPVQMSEAGLGYLYIYYGHVGVFVSNESTDNPDFITVLNSETGKVAEVYRLPRSHAGLLIPACAKSSDDFLFLGTSKDNHLEVVRYVSR